jgi:flagella basal body P-ring formation protein FlgA
VNRGDSVRVEVQSGSMRLVLTGYAESGGSRGETVLIRNPNSGKTFSAKVDGAGQVLVVAGPASGPVTAVRR